MYLRIAPNKISFSLQFSDGSGDRIKVDYDPRREDISITDSGTTILVHPTDVEWLRTALDHCLDIYKETHPIQQEPQ
jgi:hypothetical protein